MQQSAQDTLKLLGIDVWVLRGRGGGAGSEVQKSEQRPRRGDASRILADAALRAAPAPPAAPTRSVAAGAQRPAAVPAPDLDACRVLSLDAGTVLFLCRAEEVNLARRFGRDLLAALGAGTPETLTERLFDWDPASVGGAAVSGRRALAAFVRRQLTDRKPAVVLLGADLLTLLPAVADEVTEAGARQLAIPELRELARDGEAKRRLWTSLQALSP